MRFSVKAAAKRMGHLLLVSAAMLAPAIAARGQSNSNIDGHTPPALAPGAPAGSYRLSDLEQINLYSGHLNLTLPVLSVQGRGQAGLTVGVNTVKSGWKVDHFVTYNPPGYGVGESWVHTYYPNINWWNDFENRPFRPGGLMIGRKIGENLQACYGGGPPYFYGSTNTRIIFTAPDGTEYKLVSLSAGDQPLTRNCQYDDGSSRGKVFVTTDGTAATFISDSEVHDHLYVQDPTLEYPETTFGPTGYLLLRDGTRYRFLSGKVQWMRDRNGNTLRFAYGPTGTDPYPSEITDSLNRKVTFAYDVQDGAPYGLCDKITFKGSGGAERVVRVSYQTLGNALRPGQYLKTYGQLFPELDGWGTFNPSRMVSAVWLPDGRSYKFYYNSYAELARVELPTGGATEYDHEGGEVNGTLSGVVGEYTMSREYQYAPKIGIYRRLKERRVYPDGVTLESLTRYGRGGALDGSVTVDHYPSATGPKIAGAKNYHYGSPITSAVYPSGVGSPAWDEGKEFKAESFSETDALLRRVSQTWQTGGSGPRVVETTTTLADVTPNLVSKVTHINPSNPSQVGYDQYNNPTDVWEYDYGPGAPGTLLRRTHTDYLTAGYDTVVMSGSNPDALATVHLRGLATQQQVYDAAGVLRAQTGYEYDNYNQGSADNFHAALTDRSAISGLASRNDTPPGASYSPTADYPRGNVTKTTRYLLDASGGVTGSVSGYAQYDIAGNVVKTVDPRSTTSNIIATTFDFTDRFGAPNGEAQSNAAPSELSSSGQASYAFPTKVTNALGHIAYTQFDYFLGKAVDSEDANNVKSSIYYEDVLDRPTKSIVGIHATDTLAKRQTVFVYNDTGSVVNGYPAKSITTIGDRDTFGESGQQTPTGIKATAFYDGLGRTWRQATYEGNTGGGNTWSVVETQFDALGRAYRACNPFRAAAPDAALPASPEWTTTAFDALGRAVSVTTPDGAHVDTAYSGNRVLVSDQAKAASSTHQPGAQRISETDALGRLKAVWEVRSPDAASGTVSVSFPGHAGVTAGYKTAYDYDALGNLVQVAQGAQRRWFAYDSLSRLIRARNPEQGTYAFTPAVSVSGMASGTSETNSSWSLAYAYDNSGNLTQRTDARNVTTTYTYDSLSRSTQVSYSDGTPTVQYQFDTATNGKGHLHYEMTAVAGGSLRSVDSYDALGRPLVQRQHFVTPTLMANGVQWLGLNWSPAYTVTRTYDRAGGVKTQTYPSGRGVTYTYNDAAQLSDFAGTLHDGTQRNYATGIKYTAAGQVAKETFGTQTLLYHNLHYNKRQQLVDNRLGTNNTDEWTWNRAALISYYSLAAASAGNPFLDSADNNGNLIAQRHFVPDNDAITGYKVPQNDVYYYDALNRVTKVEETPFSSSGVQPLSFSQRFLYDRWGNRTIDQTTWGANINKALYTVDAATNRFTQPGYDAAGNVTTDGGQARTYDAENRMKTAGSHVYTYDASGRRVRRAIFTGSVWQTYWQVYGMSGELVAEYLAETQPAAPYGEYGYRNGLLLVTSNCADGLRWVMTDHLASARVEVSLQGGVAKRHDYLPFGEELYAGSGNHDLRGQVGGYPGADCIRQKFTGKERDTETGLDFFGARHYASVQGRFTGVDPVKLTSARLPRPQGLNLYTYALNNPLKMVDPDGKDVYLANDDEEDRRKSLDLILVNTTDAEKKNIRYRRNANGKFELYVKDPSKIDLSKASAGYKKLVDRINNHDLKIGVSYVRQGGSASLEPMGMQGTISHREVMNGHGGGVTITMDESNIGVYIAEGAGKSGVIGLTASGKETPIAQFEHIVMAHELFGETLKYTPEGRRAGLNQDAHRIDDSNKVIDIENEVRTFHGLPKRSYNGHINLDSMEIKAK